MKSVKGGKPSFRYAKPSKCEGCPLWRGGEGGFVLDELVRGAPVFVLGQNPGEEEEIEGRPFIGKTGEVMSSTYFPAAGLIRGENVSIGNVLKCRVYQGEKGTNNLPTGKTRKAAVAHCTQAYLQIPTCTKLIVAQGALAWEYVTKNPKLNISDWRGYLAPGT